MQPSVYKEREFKHVHLAFVKGLMVTNGTWPLKLNGWKKILYKLNYEVGFWFIIVITFTTTYGSVISIKKDFVKGTADLAVTIAFILTAIRSTLFRSKTTHEIIEKIGAKEQSILEDSDDDIKKLYSANVVLVSTLLRLYNLLGKSTSVAYCLTSLLANWFKPLPFNEETGIQEHRMIFASWYPFDPNSYYLFAYALQCLSCFYVYMFLIYYDIFFLFVLTFVIIRIKILQHMFKNFSKYCKRYSKTKLISEEVSQIRYLKICIEEHQAIIRFVEELDDVLYVVNFVNFIVSSFQLSLVVFEAMQGSLSNSEKIAPVTYFFTFSSQLFLYYWNAQEITILSEGLREAVFHSEWYEYTLEVRKMMTMIILRTQRPLQLSVGPVYQMEVTVLFKIYKTLYSCVAALLIK